MKRIELLLHLLVLSTIFLIDKVCAQPIMVGGDDAKDGQFGYPVSLQNYNAHVCGGGIIAERYVVIAAHCLINNDNEFNGYLNLTVVAGVTDLSVHKPKNKVTIDVEEISMPSEYDRRVLVDRDGDIAVLKLKEDFNFEKHSYLSKLELPNSNASYAHLTAIITSFGANEVDIEYNPSTHNEEPVAHRSFDKMRHAKVYVQNDDSKVLFGNIVQRNPLKPEGICAGDSGSPLVYDNTLIGVVSGSAGDCRDDRQPAIYTRFASYVDFIHKVLQGDIDKDVRHFVLKDLRQSGKYTLP